jgi:hypothetical protein
MNPQMKGEVSPLWTLYGSWQPTLRCIITTNRTGVWTSVQLLNHPRGYVLLTTNEEMGEAGLAARQVLQEQSSILVPGFADA